MRILTFIMVLLCNSLFAQQMEIAWLRVSHLQTNEKNLEFSVHDNTGPYVYLKVVIINNTGEETTIEPSKAEYFVSFKHDNNIYRHEVVPIAFMDNRKLHIKTNEQIEFNVGVEIFYGTKIFDDEKSNYLHDLIKALPTLRITYIDKEHKMTSKGIDEVFIK